MKLGKRELDDLVCPPDQTRFQVSDDATPGLVVVVSRSGEKTFFYRYRGPVDRQARRLRLGVYGEMTLAQAREQAAIAHADVLRGVDVFLRKGEQLADANRAKEAARQRASADALTVAVLIGQYDAGHLVHKKSSYRREALRALRKNLAGLEGMPARTVTRAVAQAAIEVIAQDHQPMARRTLAYARAMFSWAMDRELVPDNPFGKVAPPGKDVPRERVLSPAEIGEMWHAIQALGPPFGPYLSMLLLTLQRRGEVAGMEWTELSEDFSEWEIPSGRTKNGETQIVPLPETCRAILRSVPRLAGSRFVFTTTGKTPLSGFSGAKKRIQKAIAGARAEAAGDGEPPAAMPHWVMHDFRRTVATALVRRGVSQLVVEKLLNHMTGMQTPIAKVYNRHDYLPERRDALEAWASHVLECAERCANPSNVINLATRRQGGESTIISD